jgi:predicted O-linked N-acetylglucosamine transferase (SPINDLY family)
MTDQDDQLGQAVSLHRQGRLAEAVALYRPLVARQPDYAELRVGLGVALYQMGERDEATGHFERALELAPDLADAHSHLGIIYNSRGDFRAAAQLLSRAVELNPADFSSLCNLGFSHEALGRFEEAARCFRQAIGLNPAIAQIHSNLATVLTTLDRTEEAAAALMNGIVLDPSQAELYSNLGGVMLRSVAKHSAQTVTVLMRAVRLAPALPMAQFNLGLTLVGQGYPDQAIPFIARAAELDPSPANLSRVLFNLNYCDSLSRETVAAEHLRLGALLDQTGAPHRPALGPRRAGRHRIGFLSGDFRTHSVAYFLLPLLRAIDREKFEIFCYSAVTQPDSITEEIQGLADHWRDGLELSDAELAARIRSDDIDSLIDLAGHTPGNRLAVFARRPARRQASWLGYANTTGLKSVDYRIVDALTDPPGDADSLASETLLRLPGGFLCYEPPPDAPEPAPRPATGPIVFGTFNNPTKITDATFTLWSRVLRRVPRSRLLIKSFRLKDAVLRDTIRAKFAGHGIEPARLELLDANADQRDHLAAYGQIDIGLDPVLYNGTTTTCEALWMGVPVIALWGDRHAGRVGASLLTQIGLPELVAETEDRYVEIAAALAGDPARRADLRKGLRERMAASPLRDAPAFARKFERALLAAAEPLAPDLALDVLAAQARSQIEAPRVWTEAGQPERHANQVENTLRGIRQRLITAEDTRQAADAALAIAAAARLAAAASTDLPLLELVRERAGLIEFWLSRQTPPLDHELPPSTRTRPRLGCLRASWAADGDAALASAHLDSVGTEADIVLYHITDPAAATAHRSVRLPDNVAAAVEALRADDLDILLIGEDVSTVLSVIAILSAFRLARFQVVTAACPISTGFARIDAYLADHADAPDAAQSAFSEPLILPRAGVAPRDWIPAGPPPVTLTRGELGIPEGVPLMASGARLDHLTVELMTLWGRILARADQAHLVLYPFDRDWANSPSLPAAERHLRALVASAGADPRRLTLLPPGVSKAGARAVLALADLYLGQVPALAPVELFDPLAADLPLLLYRGNQMRSRRAAAIAKAFGLPALIAETPADYEEQALALIAAPQALAALRAAAPAARERLNQPRPQGGSDLLESWHRHRAKLDSLR